ncbi:MAG: peptidylprolyl isomerase [Burkholderiales bacterium]|nr:peptidylprolyl isomerase [Burkholderiales bacterium]
MGVTVNGVAVDTGGFPSAEAAAAHELLRQRAVALGLAAEGGRREEAERAIERLLEREVAVPEPGEAECRRYYDAHPEEFASGELAFARHILFQVTPGTPVPALRARAESVLAELAQDPSRFEALARELSNCPSGQHGGNLGQLGRGDTVPEFEQPLFNGAYTGVYPQLVKTRFGFHILAVDRRAPGRRVPFEAVRGRIAERMRGRTQQTALAQYVTLLAGQAEIRGADLAAAATPLVQ